MSVDQIRAELAAKAQWKVGASFACGPGESSAWVTADFANVADAKAVAAFVSEIARALLVALDRIEQLEGEVRRIAEDHWCLTCHNGGTCATVESLQALNPKDDE